MTSHRETDCDNNRDYVVPYEPPEWATNLKIVPKYKVNLGNDDTPIHRWYLPKVPDEFKVHIKRDDMSGSELSGNKVKKLEFLLADAIDKGCTSVVTIGGYTSNHCRCTALAARRVGLQPHLIVRTPSSNCLAEDVPCSGNALLYRMAGAQLYLAPPKGDFHTELLPRMRQLVEKFKKERNEDMYPIALGGSCSIGIYGCIESFQVLLQQNVAERFTDIVIAIGSCGNVAGLAIGNYLTGSKLKIHGLCVVYDRKFNIGEINRSLEELGLRDSNQSPSSGLHAEDIIDIIDDAQGLGFAVSSPHELDFLCEVASSTGIVLDPTYTGKAVLNLLKQLKEKPERFQGREILFIHTGGIFGLFDGRMDSVLKYRTTKHIHNWMELSEETPFELTAEGDKLE